MPKLRYIGTLKLWRSTTVYGKDTQETRP